MDGISSLEESSLEGGSVSTTGMLSLLWELDDCEPPPPPEEDWLLLLSLLLLSLPEPPRLVSLSASMNTTP